MLLRIVLPYYSILFGAVRECAYYHCYYCGLHDPQSLSYPVLLVKNLYLHSIITVTSQIPIVYTALPVQFQIKLSLGNINKKSCDRVVVINFFLHIIITAIRSLSVHDFSIFYRNYFFLQYKPLIFFGYLFYFAMLMDILDSSIWPVVMEPLPSPVNNFPVLIKKKHYKRRNFYQKFRKLRKFQNRINFCIGFLFYLYFKKQFCPSFYSLSQFIYLIN